ncbi:MAG: AAA family ATPase [Planctomycetota bacterium]
MTLRPRKTKPLGKVRPDRRRPEAKRRKRIIEHLLAKDRVLLEARMLPTEGPLTEDQIQDVRDAFDRLSKDASGRRSFTFSDLARAIGRSPSVVSQWYKGSYPSNLDAITRDINNWIERTVQRERSTGNRAYVETWVCETMAAHVRLVDRRRKMGVIVSPSGSGKDMVIDVLGDELNAVSVYCNVTTTPKRLLVALAEQLGIASGNRNAGDLQARIVDAIKDRSTIIFINEAQQLDDRCASVLRAVYDESGVPVVLLGSKQIFEMIRNADKASGGGQFWRRCLKLEITRRAEQTLDPDTQQVGRRLFSQEEIKKFLAMKKVRLAKADGPEVFGLLVDIANLDEHGSLGLLNDVVEMAMDLHDSAPIERRTVFDMLEICLGTESLQIVDELEELEAERAVAA